MCVCVHAAMYYTLSLEITPTPRTPADQQTTPFGKGTKHTDRFTTCPPVVVKGLLEFFFGWRRKLRAKDSCVHIQDFCSRSGGRVSDSLVYVLFSSLLLLLLFGCGGMTITMTVNGGGVVDCLFDVWYSLAVRYVCMMHIFYHVFFLCWWMVPRDGD